MEMLKDKSGKMSSKRMWGTVLLLSATLMEQYADEKVQEERERIIEAIEKEFPDC